MAKRRRFPEELGIGVVIVLVVAIFSLMSPTFRTVDNANLLLLNGAVIAFLAMGQAFVLLTGGIDLSTGSNIALTGMIAALAMRSGLPWWVASLAALAVGPQTGLRYDMGLGLGHKGFAAATIGGYTSLGRDFLGGLALGLCEAALVLFLSGELKETATYALIILLLVLAPAEREAERP